MTPDELLILGADLRERTGDAEAVVYDLRIDDLSLARSPSPQLLDHVRHQALMRSYQGRFVLLPDEPIKSAVARMRRYYDPVGMMRLDSHRAALEAALIDPIADEVMRGSTGQTCADYVTSMLQVIQSAPPGEFLSWLDGLPQREHHYRIF